MAAPRQTSNLRSGRRREVRRTVRPHGPAWLEFLRRREVSWAALFLLAFTVCGGAATIYIGQKPRFYEGQMVADPIVARVSFEHENLEATRKARERAREAANPVYVPNRDYLSQLEKDLTNLIALGDHTRLVDVPEADRKKVPELTQAALTQLGTYVQGAKQIEQWEASVRAFLERMFQVGILPPKEFRDHRFNDILVEYPIPVPGRSTEMLISPNDLYALPTPELDKAQLERERSSIMGRLERAASEASLPGELHGTVVSLVMSNLQPTYTYSEERSRQAAQAAYDRERPVRKTYEAQETLFKPGVRLKAEDVDLLDEAYKAFQAKQRLEYRALSHMGVFGLVLLVGLGVWGYIFAYNPKIARNPMRGFALTALLLLCQFMAVAFAQWQPKMIIFAGVFPTLMAVMVLTIVYDQRFALAIGAFQTMLVMLSLDLPIGFGIVLIAGIATAVASLREVRTRSKLVVVGASSGAVMAVTTLLTSVATRDLQVVGEIERILKQETLHALLAGISVGLVVQGVLPFIERVFRVTTAMTLKELNDASHPLLQRLAQEAAGTYQHSLRIADMAEGAAEAIDADGLLCRVGAMYHDIGKINKPQYFIENQGGGPNKHAKLSPAMSLLIIVGHVKDGVEMAREYGLPISVRHFIESHHGTTLVEYFYHAAKKQKEAQEEDAPSEFEFRYPGPKPQTKEAAIMLLCDSIEAAARSLAEPTPIRLEQLVHAMANKRLMDGQFDECALTLQELHKIENAITKTLCAVYHSRIKYPGDRDGGSGPLSTISADPTPRPTGTAELRPTGTAEFRPTGTSDPGPGGRAHPAT